MFPNIDAERGRNRMSQEYLAKTLGVSPRTFRNWMTGKTEIPGSALVKMSRMFSVSTDYLLGLERRDPNA